MNKKKLLLSFFGDGIDPINFNPEFIATGSSLQGAGTEKGITLYSGDFQQSAVRLKTDTVIKVEKRHNFVFAASTNEVIKSDDFGDTFTVLNNALGTVKDILLVGEDVVVASDLGVFTVDMTTGVATHTYTAKAVFIIGYHQGRLFISPQDASGPLYSDDLGVTTTPSTYPFSTLVHAFHGAENGDIYAGGSDAFIGKILRSTDNGVTFVDSGNNYGIFVYSIAELLGGRIIFSANTDGTYITDDFSTFTKKLTLPGSADIVTGIDKAYVLDRINQLVYETHDGAENFQTESIPYVNGNIEFDDFNYILTESNQFIYDQYGIPRVTDVLYEREGVRYDSSRDDLVQVVLTDKVASITDASRHENTMLPGLGQVEYPVPGDKFIFTSDDQLLAAPDTTINDVFTDGGTLIISAEWGTSPAAIYELCAKVLIDTNGWRIEGLAGEIRFIFQQYEIFSLAYTAGATRTTFAISYDTNKPSEFPVITILGGPTTVMSSIGSLGPGPLPDAGNDLTLGKDRFTTGMDLYKFGLIKSQLTPPKITQLLQEFSL